MLLLVLLSFSWLLLPTGCAEEDENLLLFRDVLQLARTAYDARQCGKNGQLRHQRIGEFIRQVEGLIEADLAVQRKKIAVKRQILRRRIAIPSGTRLSLTPTLQMPFVPGLPDGFLSNLTLSFPFTIIFDDVQLRPLISETLHYHHHLLGIFPILRRMWKMVFPWRGRRSPRGIVEDEQQEVLEHPSTTHRKLIYGTMERLLEHIWPGLAGRHCLLRAMCEANEFPLDSEHGLLGEAVQLLFTASGQPDEGRDLLVADYIKAEESGRLKGDCRDYHVDCPRSFFTTSSSNIWSDS